MSFPRYGAYKDSGVEWLGEVPRHWRTGKIRQFAKLESGHTPSRQHPEWWENCTIPWFSLGDVWQIREGRATHVYETKEFVSELGLANSSARLLPKGTVILSRTASVGFSAIMGCDMATTQDFANWVCGPDLIPEFLLMTLRAMKGEFDRLMMGSTHQTIYMPDIAKLALALPPRNEQSAIISFLDRETAKIDALVEEQQRLIALLEEKRQAVISHAVTKGLDPNAPMKDSGVEWLGDVPAHWETVQIKRLAKIRYGIGEPPKYQEEGTPLIRATNVDAGRIRSEGLVFINPEDLPESRIIWLEPGDIIVVRSGAYTGDSAIIREEQCPCVAGFDMVLRVHGCESDFLQFALLSWHLKNRQLDIEKLRAAQPHLNAEELGASFLLLPPPAEQLAVVRFLQNEASKIDLLTAEAKSAIALLQERRSALISAAVTGKIDVRGLAPQSAEAAA
jgi:type I restriction enzyme S subunit